VETAKRWSLVPLLRLSFLPIQDSWPTLQGQEQLALWLVGEIQPMRGHDLGVSGYLIATVNLGGRTMSRVIT
jgi:hypothetical protein